MLAGRSLCFGDQCFQTSTVRFEFLQVALRYWYFPFFGRKLAVLGSSSGHTRTTWLLSGALYLL
jgi:hypothetical protein